MNCHMMFDIRMEDFHHNARLLVGGHVTESPDTITYEIVLSRETVRIDFSLYVTLPLK